MHFQTLWNVSVYVSLINVGHLRTILLKYGLQDFHFDIESTYLASGFVDECNTESRNEYSTRLLHNIIHLGTLCYHFHKKERVFVLRSLQDSHIA